MNKQHLVAIALSASLASGLGALTGCGSNAAASNDVKPNSGSASTARPGSAGGPTAVVTAENYVLAPGTAGQVKVGMSKAAADRTGLFEIVSSPAEGCAPELAWKQPLRDTFDVETLDNGEIASIGVYKSGPKTATGLEVGSTLAEVLAANPGAMTARSGYGQTGVLIHDKATDGWIGYLFNPELGDVKKSDTVTFIELTEGEKPSLMRDGC